MGFFQYLLFPFSLLYGLVTSIRNYLFDIGYKTSFEFQTNVIGIGNLSVGGTGKTPMVEYVIRLLKDKKIVTLSRGYGRKTKGFRIANENDNAKLIGDEPYQFYRKFPNIEVTVGEERAMAIPEILAQIDPELIVMDDSFQHRYVKPSLNIMLTDYNKPFFNDFVLPQGRLRESRKGAKRADIIVVTKSPNDLSSTEVDEFKGQIQKYSSAPIFFASIEYHKPVAVNADSAKPLSNVLLFSGLANNQPFTEYISERYNLLDDIYFSDHHNYTARDLNIIEDRFRQLGVEDKCIITTEKDYVKLLDSDLYSIVEHWPLFYAPISVLFIKDGNMFDELIFKSLNPDFNKS